MDSQISRRSGIIAGLAGVIAVMSGRAKAEEKSPFAMSTSQGSQFTIEARGLEFNLAAFKEFTFTLGAETITLTPAEVMAALKDGTP